MSLIRKDLIDQLRVKPGKQINLKDFDPGWEQSKELKELGKDGTDEAPWYVVPADQKWITRAVVADVITSSIQALDMRYPEVSAGKKKALAEAREALTGE